MNSNKDKLNAQKVMANMSKDSISANQYFNTGLQGNSAAEFRYQNIFNLNQPSRRHLLNKIGFCYGYCVSSDLQIQCAEKRLFDDLPSDFNIPDSALRHNDTSHQFTKITSEKVSKELYSKGFTSAGIEGDIMKVARIDLHGSMGFHESSANNHQKNCMYGELCFPKGEFALSEIRSKVCAEAREFFKSDEDITLDKLNQFFQTYGAIVPTRVTLGGKLFVSQELDQDSKSNNNASSAQLEAKMNCILKNIGGSMKGDAESKSMNLDFRNKQEFILNCIGGIPELMGNPENWIRSLENSESWGLITINCYKFSYDYLEEPVRSKIIKLLKPENQKMNPENSLALQNQVSEIIDKFENSLFALKIKGLLAYLTLTNKSGPCLLYNLTMVEHELGCKESIEQVDPFRLQKLHPDKKYEFLIKCRGWYLKLKERSIYLKENQSEGSIFSFDLLSETGSVALRQDNLYLVYNKMNKECKFLDIQEIQQLGNGALKDFELQQKKLGFFGI